MFGSDGSLHHLHVAITPFLKPLVEIEQPLKNECCFLVAAVRRRNHARDVFPCLVGLARVALEYVVWQVM